ncbi:DNA repair protein rad16 [Chytriomyces hyalinus]|nr:DNA repair protein rad16 [Chytriomyces hyalinus]
MAKSKPSTRTSTPRSSLRVANQKLKSQPADVGDEGDDKAQQSDLSSNESHQTSESEDEDEIDVENIPKTVMGTDARSAPSRSAMKDKQGTPATARRTRSSTATAATPAPKSATKVRKITYALFLGPLFLLNPIFTFRFHVQTPKRAALQSATRSKRRISMALASDSDFDVDPVDEKEDSDVAMEDLGLSDNAKVVKQSPTAPKNTKAAAAPLSKTKPAAGGRSASKGKAVDAAPKESEVVLAKPTARKSKAIPAPATTAAASSSSSSKVEPSSKAKGKMPVVELEEQEHDLNASESDPAESEFVATSEEEDELEASSSDTPDSDFENAPMRRQSSGPSRRPNTNIATPAAVHVAITTGATENDGDEAPVAPVAPAPRRRRPVTAESKLSKEEKLWAHHPELRTVWDELEAIPKIEIPEICPQPDNIMIKLLPFQLEGVHWLKQQEQSRFNGGILADEMGMGKTIQIISLIAGTKNTVKPNLILTPTVAILQWLSELKERVSPNFLNICVFHGTNRETSVKNLEAYDVVLSTFAIVESLYRKQQHGFKRQGEMVKAKSILHAIDWGRVVLDEAHSIKDRSSSTARAVFNLKARYKWSVTGTPLQNRVGELYSLIRFLDADPFSHYFCRQCPCKMKTWSFSNHRHCDECGHISHSHFCWWNSEILKPIQNYGGVGDGLVAFKKLGVLLDRIMLRRTKLERADDLGLPPRVIHVRRDVFNEAEEELYESLYTDSQRQFGTYVASNTVLNNYASIFSLLSRMRLAVNHPDLVTTKMKIKDNMANESLVCGICQEVAEDAVISKCKHVFCREDVRGYMLSCPEGQVCNCPVCFRPLTLDLSQQEYEGTGKLKNAPKTSIVNYIDMSKWRSSTKIEALVEELTIMQRDDATMKSIVFSQFVAFLDLIHWRLSRAGFNCVKLDGRMTPQGRDAVIQSFMKDPSVTIFLVSLKAGGVALNLTEASRVFILDPWWNPAVEDQAFDRIHRLGQHRPIRITRLIIENSIESRILQLQDKKKTLFQSTVGKDMDALSKLSEEDLAFLFVL